MIIPQSTFPLAALPKPLRAFVRGVAGAMGVPPEIVATPAVAVLASAIGNSYRVWINPSWQEPAILWTLTLLVSGSLKTPPYKMAMRPLVSRQINAETEYQNRLSQYEQDIARYEVDFAAWKKSKGIGEAPAKPEPPTPVDLYTSDATVEAIGLLLQRNPRGGLLARDELSGFLGSFGAYKGGKGGDEANYLESYTGGTIKVNRASGKRLFVPHASLSITGTCQPKVFERAIRGEKNGDGNQIENGLTARFLITAPIMPPKRWNPGTMPQGVEEEFSALAGSLLDLPLAMDGSGNAAPRDVPLDLAAQKRFSRFVNEHGAETARIADDALRYHFAKLEGVAARLALVLHLVRVVSGEASPDNVDTLSVEQGIMLAKWFGGEARRVYARFTEDAGECERRELVEVIERHGGSITTRELAHASRRYREPGAAETALIGLAHAGIGRWEVGETTEAGGRPATRFVFGDAYGGNGNTTPENPEKNEVSLPFPPQVLAEVGTARQDWGEV